MAVIAVEDQTLSNWLKMEFGADLAYCRDQFVFNAAAGTKVPHGTVLGTKTAGGVGIWNPTASDGTEVATAIVFNTFVTTGANQNILAMNRGPASINKLGLVVPAGTTDAQYLTLRANLEKIGIQVLETVDVEI